MKKKSFIGINVKLALMLVAICGMFASCYEKEELTTEAPSTVAPVYKVAGVVSDANTGAPIAGAKVNTATTGADGAYELSAKAGLNVITVSKDNYQTVTSSVFVETIENGKSAAYTVNAAMYPGQKPPTYKTVKYSIKGTATNTAGTAVALKSVVIAGINNVVVAGNTFTAAEVQPGTYAAVITAEGYKKVFASVNVTPVPAQVGEGTQNAISEVSVIMQKPGEQAKYMVQGIVSNKEGKAVIGAAVKLETTNGYSVTATSDAKGAYSFNVPFEKVAPTAIGVISITKAGYKTQSKGFMIQPEEEGSTIVTKIDMVLESASAEVPEEDPSTGGDATVNVPVESAKPEKTEDALKKEEVKSGIEQVAKDLGLDLNTIENIPVVNVEKASVMELVSIEAVVDAAGNITQETKAVSDQITIPAGTKIYYVAGTAQNISLKRDIATEKASAAVRTYEGQPSGTVFSKPLEINFQAPTAITTAPDYVLGVLYLNEGNNTWRMDKDNYAEFDMASQTFIGKIRHFSKFKFGYESKVTVKDSLNLPKEYINKPCFTGSFSKNITVNGTFKGGSAYAGDTPTMAAEKALAGKNPETVTYVARLLTNMIKTANANVLPKNDYVDMKMSFDLTIPAFKQVNGFNMVRKQVSKTYTVNVIDKNKKTIAVSVVVKSIISVTLDADLALGHSHGHGHGEDLNAGGGVIDCE